MNPIFVTRAENRITSIRGRSFACVSKDGQLDGSVTHGVYSQDVRIIRRAEVFGPTKQDDIKPEIVVDADGAALRFTVPDIEPDDALLLIVEIDGEDAFQIQRQMADTTTFFATEKDRNKRPPATVLIDATCEDYEPEHKDGVALSLTPISADGTPKTALWRWRRPKLDTDKSLKDVVIELKVGWSTTKGAAPAQLRSFEEIETLERVETSHWLKERPKLKKSEQFIQRVFDRSIDNLAKLRIDGDDGVLLAADAPWDLTVRGRDTILSAYMMLPFDPRIAKATLRHLAKYQADTYDPSISAEPGKIMHEQRTGVAAYHWHEKHYGSIDATSLYVILALKTWQWTQDQQLLDELKDTIIGCVNWILARIEEDSYHFIASTSHTNSANSYQTWRTDSGSYRDKNGIVGSENIYALEAQGYAISALTAAATISDALWPDCSDLANDWRRSSERLLTDFTRSFTVLPNADLDSNNPRRKGFLAVAIDDTARSLDSLTSDIGRILWADTLHDSDVTSNLAKVLAHHDLWSGWGIRTMSASDLGFTPKSLYCGGVWSYDTALAVAGMAKVAPTLAGIVGGSLFATSDASGALPECFSGAARGSDEVSPETIETSTTIHACTAAAPLLILTSLLGLEPNDSGELVSTMSEVPGFLRDLRISGIYCAGKRWEIEVNEAGRVSIEGSPLAS